MSSYTNKAQQRILRLLTILAGNEVHGLTPTAIAQAQGCTASVVTSDLANLREAGMAEQVPETNAWRLAPQIVQIAIRHQMAIDRAQERLDEIRSRYSRT